MSYIGVQPGVGQYRKLDDISGSFNGATTTFTTSVDGINVTAGSPQQLLVSVGGVIQQPVTDYSTSTNSITFSTAPAGGLDFFAVLMGDAINVGIPSDGSVTSAKLNSDLTIDLASGTAGAPSLTFDSDTGLYSPGANAVGIATNGTAAVTVDSSQRVGIGTTSVGFGAIDHGVHIYGSGAQEGIRLETTNGSGGILEIYAENGGNTLDTRGSGYIRFNSVATEWGRWDSSGRLLVGTSSAGGTELIQVQGVSSSSTAPGGIALRRSSIGNTDDIGFIAFTNASGNVHAQIRAFCDGTPGASDYPGALVFSTTADGASSPTERLRLDSAGSVVLASGTAFVAPYVYNTTTATGANVNVDASGFLRRSTSSIKYKTNVETIQDQYADAILGCRPVWYQSTCEADKPDWGHWGFIAEEVAAIDPRLCFFKEEEEDGTLEPEGVQYDRFVPHLLNLIKRQGEAIADLQAEVAALKAQ